MSQEFVSLSNIYQWVAKASTPDERISFKGFIYSQEQNLNHLRLRQQQWNQTLSYYEINKSDYLKQKSITEAQWNESMQDVEIADPQQLPQWALVFIELFELWQHQLQQGIDPYLSLSPIIKEEKHALLIWPSLCQDRIQQKLNVLNQQGIYLSDDSTGNLYNYLINRLYTPVTNTLIGHFSLQPTNPFLKPQTQEDWVQLFQSFEFWKSSFEQLPILTRVLGTLIGDWDEVVEEMFDRFIEDLPLLKKHFLNAGSPSDKAQDKITVHKIACGLGDPHRQGRPVTIFETNRGSVVYKPKALIGTEATGFLLQELHQLHPEFVPLTPKFLQRGNYGWEEKIVVRECTKTSEVATFYRRLGGWLSLVQLLNGNDFWYDNLLSCGDMPYFIDFETIVGNTNHKKYFPHLENIPGYDSLSRLQISGILPILMPGNSLGQKGSDDPEDGIDISVMVPPGKQRTPFLYKGSTSSDAPSTEVDPELAKKLSELDAKDFALYLNGQFQDINNHLDKFIDGYRQMSQLLLSKTGKAALEMFYQRITQARFRYIIIDTWSCYSLLSFFFMQYRPDGLRAAIAIDILLVKLNYLPFTLAKNICHDLIHNDIPLFEIQPNNIFLYGADGSHAEEDFFKQTPLDKIRANYQSFEAELEQQIEFIKAIYSCRTDHPKRPLPQIITTPKSTTKADSKQAVSLLSAINSIGDQLVDIFNLDITNYLHLRHTSLTNDLGVVTIGKQPSGVSGAIVFLSHLLELSPQDQYRQIVLNCFHFLMKETDYESIITTYKLPFLYGTLSDAGATIMALGVLNKQPLSLDLIGDDLSKAIHEKMQEFINKIAEESNLYADYQHGISGVICMFKLLQTSISRDTLAIWLEQLLALLAEKPLIASPKQTPAYTNYFDRLQPNCNLGIQLAHHYLKQYWPEKINHQGCINLLKLTSDSEALAPVPDSIPLSNQVAIPNMTQLHLESTETLLSQCYQLHIQQQFRSIDQKDLNAIAGEMLRRKAVAGRWLVDEWASDQFRVGALYGLADIGLALSGLELGHPINPFRSFDWWQK